MHERFAVGNEQGLATMLSGESPGFSAVQRLEHLRRLVVLSAGPPPSDPAELLANGRLGRVLDAMAREADFVIVDAPPVLAVTDASLIAQSCDAAVLVAVAEQSDRREMAEALRRLAVVDTNVIGTVLLQQPAVAYRPTEQRYAPRDRQRTCCRAGRCRRSSQKATPCRSGSRHRRLQR